MINYVVYDPAEGRVIMEGYVPTRQDISAGEGLEFITLPGKLEACDVEQVKQALWDRLKDKQVELLSIGIATFKGVVDADEASLNTLSRLANLAWIVPNSEQPFTFKNNETLVLNSVDMIQLFKETTTETNALHSWLQTLRIEITDAETVEDVLKINTLIA